MYRDYGEELNQAKRWEIRCRLQSGVIPTSYTAAGWLFDGDFWRYRRLLIRRWDRVL